jgi:tetraacyldisaccharide 4'-kinase
MNHPARLLLAPLSGLYGALGRLRFAAYRSGWLKQQSVAAPVFSVGNLTTGGTGKTPLVAWAAQVLADEGRRVCILTRGYGRVNPKERVIVSDGQNLLADARNGGDEARWLAEKLQGRAAVIADKNRVAAARWALAEWKSDCFALDDGFQHWQLARDCDLVTIDATNPWGGGYLLPRGRLREPLNSLRRASAIVITRAEQAGEIETLRQKITEISGGRPVFVARNRVSGVRPLWPERHGPLVVGSPALAFCALGNPSAFFRQAIDAGHRVAGTLAFRDHHAYAPEDLRQIVAKAKEAGAEALLTTAKDAVKLAEFDCELPLFVLEIEPEFDREAELRELLLETV